MIGTLIAGLILAGSTSTHIKVDGQGYMRFCKEGAAVYTAEATLTVRDGKIVHENGTPLLPSIQAPSNTEDLQVDLEGNVFAIIGGKQTRLGRLVLALFPENSPLSPEGAFLIARDRPKLSNPGEGVCGVIREVGNASHAAPKAAPKPEFSQPKIVNTQPAAKPMQTQQAKQDWTPPANWDGPIEIIVHNESVVNGETILLGEIATIHASRGDVEALSAVEMGRAPIVGVNRGISRNMVIAWLRRAGYKIEDWVIEVPEGATLHQKANIIPAEKFIEIAQKAAMDEYGVPTTLKSTRNNALDFKAPIGQLELTIVNTVQSSTGIAVTIAVNVDGRRVTSKIIMLEPQQGAEGVKAGSDVKVIMRSNGAVLEISARARTSGWIGQSVTVITATGSKHVGTVISPNVVEVKL